MPVETLMQIADRGAALTWDDFGGYAFHVVAEDVCYIRRYEVRGGEYVLFVSADVCDDPIRTAIVIRLSDAARADLISEDSAFLFE